MSDDLRAKDFQSTPVKQDLRTLPGGGLVMGDWLQALIARGFGWHTTVGSLSTGIVGGGAGTVLDAEQPELAIRVQSGYTLVPIRIAVEVELGLQTTDSHVTEILIGVDRTQVPTVGTSTAEVPINMRTDITAACPLTVWSAYTADGITPVLDELARKQALTDLQGVAANMMVDIFDLVYEPLRPPFIVGPAGLFVYYGGDIAATGYIQASFLAIPSTLLTALV